MSKPVVRYKERIISDVGLCAMVLPTAPPEKEEWVTTDRVRDVAEKCFETESTIYELEE